jgi:hypothetical protein
MSNINLGTVSTNPVSKLEYVGTNPSLLDLFLRPASSGPEDIFKFNVADNNRNINITLRDIEFGQNATLQLYQDVNGNGIWDAEDQSRGLVTSSGRPDNNDESINIRAGGGTYFARVYNYGSGTYYSLDISATQADSIDGWERASNLLPRDASVGQLNSSRTLFGSVSDFKTTTTYAFSLGRMSVVDFRLTGLTSNADIRVIRDGNNNRRVDAGEVHLTSMNGGTLSEMISGNLTAGNYYLQVYQNTGNTNYTLTMNATPSVFF